MALECIVCSALSQTFSGGGPAFVIWAALHEKIPNGPSRCHTKRRIEKIVSPDDFLASYSLQTKIGLILRLTVSNMLNYSLQKKYNPPLKCQVALFYCFTPNTSNAILLETCIKDPLSMSFWYYLTWFSILTNISFSNWISSWLT